MVDNAETCFNCEGLGLIVNRYFTEDVCCPYCKGTGKYRRTKIDHRQWAAGTWGYWKDWGIKCLRCDNGLDWRNAVQPEKCPQCGYGGET